eukprot:3105789-Rhodomonas_salina.3
MPAAEMCWSRCSLRAAAAMGGCERKQRALWRSCERPRLWAAGWCSETRRGSWCRLESCRWGGELGECDAERGREVERERERERESCRERASV